MLQKYETRESFCLEHEGQKIFGMLHRPIEVEKAPVVIMFHGFGGHKCGKYRLYVTMSEKLSRLGIASIRFDFRGSGDSEGEFADMTIEGEVQDALKILQFAENIERIDPHRIGIMGRSLGGIVAVMAASRYQKIKSLALWAPAYSAEQWEQHWIKMSDPKVSAELKDELMRFDGQVANEKFMREFFALDLENDLRALNNVPLLHIHGEQDMSVNITHAEMYLQGRQKSNAETRVIRLPNTNHDFSHIAEQAFTVEETCKWFRNTL